MAIFKKGESWYIDYYIRGRRKREKIGPSKKLAETVFNKRKVEIAENKYLDIKQEKKIKFPELAEIFLNDYSKPNKRSYATDKECVKHFNNFFGNKYLYEIDSLLVEKYKNDRLPKVKQSTINRELNVLKCMFNRAIEWDMLKESPAKNVKKFVVDEKRVRYLSIEEINRLLKVCNGYLYGVVVLALNTGMRKGEILKLKWENIDFTSGIIHLPGSLSKNKCLREIPMNSIVLRTLEEIRKQSNNPYVFSKPDGRLIGNIRKAYATALRKADITNFRFHDLRHTFCSQLVNNGIDIYTVMELAGHKSIQMTMRYAHLKPEQKKMAVDILGSKMDTIWTPSQPEADLTVDEIIKIPSGIINNGQLAQWQSVPLTRERS